MSLLIVHLLLAAVQYRLIYIMLFILLNVAVIKTIKVCFNFIIIDNDNSKQ